MAVDGISNTTVFWNQEDELVTEVMPVGDAAMPVMKFKVRQKECCRCSTCCSRCFYLTSKIFAGPTPLGSYPNLVMNLCAETIVVWQSPPSNAES